MPLNNAAAHVLHQSTRAAIAASTIALITLLLRADLGGYGGNIFWTYHPVFMTLGLVLFMSFGVVTYASDYGRVSLCTGQPRAAVGFAF